MAKAKRPRAKRAPKQVKRRSMRQTQPGKVQRNMSTPVEKAVRDYISLLKDPCNGPLVGPVGATANGYITRFETTLSVNPTDGNFALIWAPGALAFTAANFNGLIGYEAATSAATFVSGDRILNQGMCPGYSFLDGTCTTYRCLAACAQIRYTDTEVNRRGIIGSTICTRARSIGSVDQALSITVDRARIPDQSLEVLWQPGDGDELFTNHQTADFDSEVNGRKNAILLAGSNCLAGSISIRLVVVYQWTPKSDDNIILPVPTPGTGVTMARVLQLAKQAGFVAGKLIAGYASGGLYGVAREAALIVRPSIRTMR